MFLELIERRLDAAASIIGHKMSMLQDLEGKRDLKLGAIVKSVQEIGQIVGDSTPSLSAVLSLAQARAKVAAEAKN